MATLSNVVCLVIHRNVIHRFMEQALKDPPLCSSTDLTVYFKVIYIFLGVIDSYYLTHWPCFEILVLQIKKDLLPSMATAVRILQILNIKKLALLLGLWLLPK
jgi:hypothetical protein